MTERPPLVCRPVCCGEPAGDELREAVRESVGVSILSSARAVASADGVEGDRVAELVADCELVDGGDEDGVEATENGKGGSVLMGVGE